MSGTNAPRLGFWFALLPIGLGVLVIGGYLFMFGVGSRGRAADGDRVRISFEGCAEAQPFLAARVDAMGLGDPRWDGLAVSTQLPRDEAVAAGIPVTLATTGALSVRVAGGSGEVVVDHTHIVEAHAWLQTLALPSTRVLLTPEGTAALRDHMQGDPKGSVALWLDDEILVEKKNVPPVENGQLVIRPSEETEQQNLNEAAARAIIVDDGPLPCRVRVAGVELLEAAEPVVD